VRFLGFSGSFAWRVDRVDTASCDLRAHRTGPTNLSFGRI